MKIYTIYYWVEKKVVFEKIEAESDEVAVVLAQQASVGLVVVVSDGKVIYPKK